MTMASSRVYSQFKVCFVPEAALLFTSKIHSSQQGKDDAKEDSSWQDEPN